MKMSKQRDWRVRYSGWAIAFCVLAAFFYGTRAWWIPADDAWPLIHLISSLMTLGGFLLLGWFHKIRSFGSAIFLIPCIYLVSLIGCAPSVAIAVTAAAGVDVSANGKVERAERESGRGASFCATTALIGVLGQSRKFCLDEPFFSRLRPGMQLHIEGKVSSFGFTVEKITPVMVP